MDPSLEAFLKPTALIDSDHPDIVAFAQQHTRGVSGVREQAVALYYAVRDGFRYDPYGIDLSDHGLRASTVLELGNGWCTTKSALMAAVCRAAGIPARVGFADVRNHLSTARMREYLETDVYYWHGYTSLLIDGRWVKATTAFNIELCQRFKLLPLEFDGTEDSIYHPFDLSGNRHMEYVHLRGEYAEVPAAEIRADFARYYPKLSKLVGADFDQDSAQEAL